MSRESNQGVRNQASVEVVSAGDVALVEVKGLVDERFAGFGKLEGMKAVVIHVAGMTRLTSFGVRQWINAMDALPKSISDLYLLSCPTFFVDQLNMVLGFGGSCKVLTVVAPFTCSGCGVETGETIDILAERTNLARGVLADKNCAKCAGKLAFDETPESYFSFVRKYAASAIQADVAHLLAARQLYSSSELITEKPPRIVKLVHGTVTYFRIIGTIGSMFRARPILVGAEGEVVIDLAEVAKFDPAGQKEWRRLLKSLTAQVPAVTLVDVTGSFLATAADSLSVAKSLAVASVLVAYKCGECGRGSQESVSLHEVSWPMQSSSHVCSICGGTTHSQYPPDTFLPIQKASTNVPTASAKLIAQRDELLSRALTDANVAQAGDGATGELGTDDTILGKYKIVRPLSAGGMAEVFIAKQIGIGGFEKTVALKRIQRKLLAARHQAIELFLNEAKIAGRLTHPNIVQVLDVGEAQGALYIAMEYVNGKDLRAVSRKLQRSRRAVPLADACFVVQEIANALHHAYWSNDMNGKRLSVVHRDVSPHNVILGFDGSVKLLDFGVATSAVTEHDDGLIVGKWLYMAPEAVSNQPVDHRSDLFSLGVILYLLCSGTMPFNGRDPKQIVSKIRAAEYKPLQEVSPNIPERLCTLTARLLSANPDDRPQRGQDVAAELADIARANGLILSGPSIVALLEEIYPDEATGTEPEITVIEIVKTSDEASGGSDRSPVSMTPSPTTSRFGIDISKTFRRSNVMKSMQTPSKGVSIPPQPRAQTAAEDAKELGAPAPKHPTHPPAPMGSGFRIAVVAVVVLLIGIGIFYLQYLYSQ